MHDLARFSDDDFQSDVHVWRTVDGITIKVASSRFVFDRTPLGPPISLEDDHAASLARTRKLHQLMDDGALERITLKNAGALFPDLSHDVAVQFLLELEDEGFRVPAHAIEAVQEDA